MSREILNELIANEPIFHRWEHLVGRSPIRLDFEQMTSPDFFEIGASGTLYTRNDVLDILEHRYTDPAYKDTPWTAGTFHLLQLADDTYLLNYTLIQHETSGDRTTRRSTIWKKTGSGWKIAFHQGTLISTS
ncbi:MAG TPA: DUF4440 domain-containing protein [Edaphobacter sp.]|nr:DUF4440 domain-containing protein [Edaphobacter sp.]